MTSKAAASSSTKAVPVTKARYNKWDVREACMQNDIPLLKLCLQRHAPLDDLDFDDDIGYIEGQIYWRPLLHAARYDHVECAQMLLDAGVAVDTKSDTGQTALLVASEHRAHGCMRLLIDRGANLRHTDKQGQRPLHMAATRGDMTGLQLLIARLDDAAFVNDKDNDGWTPLIHAAAVGFTEGVELLVDKFGCDVHQVEYGGWNALGLAVANNKLATVNKILQLAGARAAELINKPANDNWGVVYVAAQRGFDKVLQTLIDHGADVNIETDDGDIPLWTAQLKQRQACIDILLPLTHPDYLE